jgi:6-pyruvoyl-tetrahydropterin synthase
MPTSTDDRMFRLNVREHFMIAHSFKGETFGPAQALHGATYVVDLELRRPDLDADGVVCDIGRVSDVLKGVVGRLHFRNLDEEADFAGINTTTEELARWVAHRVVERIRAGDAGPGLDRALASLRVTLNESHLAWASYETDLGTA